MPTARSGRARATLAPPPPSRFVLPRAHAGVIEPRDREQLLATVRALLSTPTAPYFEDGMLAVVRALAARIPGLALRADRHGNLVALRSGAGAPRRVSAAQRDAGGARTLAFSAHLDHPGFHALVRRGRAPAAELHGGVPERFLPGAPLRFFRPGAAHAIATARIASAAKQADGRIEIGLADVRGTVASGSFGVFDLTDGVVKGARLAARVCDDLLGAAAILVALSILARENHPRPLAGVFTRAEETGFVGCIGLLEERALPEDVAVIGLECSPRRATARVGLGPVVRVGDRVSVFDPELTHGLQGAVARLQARVPGFAAQRALMDGGSCESTAYNAWGVPAGAACLALGNYHNAGADGRIAPEFVDWNDLEGLVALLVETARGFDAEAGRGVSSAAGIRARLLRSWSRESGRLAVSARRIAATPHDTNPAAKTPRRRAR
jgi:endoglucanase